MSFFLRHILIPLGDCGLSKARTMLNHRRTTSHVLKATTVVSVLSLLLLSLLTIASSANAGGVDVVVSSSSSSATTQEQQQLQPHEQRTRVLQQYPQYINPPIVTYAGFVTSLDYTLRDNVREGLMDIELYQDSTCTNKINPSTNNYLNYELIPDLTPRGDGDKTRVVSKIFFNVLLLSFVCLFVCLLFV